MPTLGASYWESLQTDSWMDGLDSEGSFNWTTAVLEKQCSRKQNSFL